MSSFTIAELEAIAEAERAGKVRRFAPKCAFCVFDDNRDPQRQQASRRAALVSALVRSYRAGPSGSNSHAGHSHRDLSLMNGQAYGVNPVK